MTPEEKVQEIYWLVVKIAHERTGAATWLFDDALQEGLLRAWERFEQGHSKKLAVHAARQAVLDVCRGRRTTGSKSYGGHVDSHRASTSIFKRSAEGEEYVLEPQDNSSAQWIDQMLDRDELGGALQALSERDRKIIHARFWEGLDIAEIAIRVNMTHQGVSAALQRAYPKLRAALEA